MMLQKKTPKNIIQKIPKFLVILSEYYLLEALDMEKKWIILSDKEAR